MDNSSPTTQEPTAISYRLKREAEGFIGKWQVWWQSKRFRRATYGVGAFILFLMLFGSYFDIKKEKYTRFKH